MVKALILLFILILPISILPVISSSSYVPGWPLSIRVFSYNYNDTTQVLTINFELKLPNPGYIISNVSAIQNESGYYIDFEIMKTTNPVIQVITYKYASVRFVNVSSQDFPLKINVLVNHKPYSVVEIYSTSNINPENSPSTSSTTKTTNETGTNTSTTTGSSSSYYTEISGNKTSMENSGRYIYIIALIIGLFTFAAAVLFVGRK